MQSTYLYFMEFVQYILRHAPLLAHHIDFGQRYNQIGIEITLLETQNDVMYAALTAIVNNTGFHGCGCYNSEDENWHADACPVHMARQALTLAGR